MSHKEIQAQIEALKKELCKLEELTNKPEKFEFRFPEGKAHIIYFTHIADSGAGNDPDCLQHGKYRLTKYGAVLALERNRRANRLEMLAEYLGGLKEFKFAKEEKHWFVSYGCNSKEWTAACHVNVYDPEKVYMTKEVAMKIADMLNNGEYEL